MLVSFMLTPFEAVRIRLVETPSYSAGPLSALRRYMEDGGGVGALYAGLLPLMVCFPSPLAKTMPTTMPTPLDLRVVGPEGSSTTKALLSHHLQLRAPARQPQSQRASRLICTDAGAPGLLWYDQVPCL